MSRAYKMLEQIADIEEKQDLINDQIVGTKDLIVKGEKELKDNRDRMDQIIASAISKSMLLDQQDRKKLEEKLDSVLSTTNKSRIEQMRLIELLSDVSQIKAISDAEKEKYDKYIAEMKRAGESQISALNDEIDKLKQSVDDYERQIEQKKKELKVNGTYQKIKSVLLWFGTIVLICLVLNLLAWFFGGIFNWILNIPSMFGDWIESITRV